jgi:hypothetical protein
MFRLLIRLVVLALAALGAKTLYDRFAPHTDDLKTTGYEFVDRAGSAARDVGSAVTDATQKVAATAKESANDVMTTAQDKAADVKAAADDAVGKVSQQLEPETANGTTVATDLGATSPN